MTNITFEDVQEFISRYTLLSVHSTSRLVKDLYFKYEEGQRFLYAFGEQFDVNMMACQPEKHFAAGLKTLSPLWLIAIPVVLLLLATTPNKAMTNTHLLITILLLALSIWFMAFLAYKNRHGEWRLPAIDLTVMELVGIANQKKWPQEIYRKHNV